MEIRSVAQFIDYYGGVRKRTGRVIDRIPDTQMEWRHAPSRFSFGDLIRHLAGVERFMFAENAAGRPSRYPGHGEELASGADAIRAYFHALHGASLEVFGSLSDADLTKQCVTPAGTPITVWKWLRAMVEHEVHHRGQIYLMLGMLEIPTPPLFGLTAEEVYQRSYRAI